MNNMKKDQILKGLIIVGLIAIAISLYIKFGQPYVNELAKQSLDQKRITDLDNLDKDISDYIANNKKFDLGQPNTIYISLPASKSNCEDISADLPSLPDNWTYHCANQNNFKKADGGGWLPVKLSGKPELPVDPKNSAADLNYYSFVSGSYEIASTSPTSTPAIKDKHWRSRPGDYTLTVVLDSGKLIKKKSMNDNGINDIRYETGNNLKMWADAEGLIGYWPMNEKIGLIINDKISNNKFNLYTQNVWSKNCGFINKSLGCINLLPKDNNLSIDKLNFKSKSILITIWVNLSLEHKDGYELLFMPNAFILYAYNTHPNLDIWSSAYIKSKQIFNSAFSSLNYNEWHQIGLYYGYIKNQDTPIIANVIDGQIMNPLKIFNNDEIKISQLFINKRQLYNGKIWNIKIFNKKQSIKDINENYNEDLKLMRLK